MIPIPKPGQYINVLFLNGSQLSGIVESWSEKQSILRSSDNKAFTVIQETAKNVMAYTLIFPSQKQIEAPKEQNELKEQFNETCDLPSTNDLRLKKLAELKTMLNIQERKEMSEKLKEHNITDDGAKLNTYHYPRFLKKPNQ